MSFERPVGPPAEPAPVPVPAAGAASAEVNPAMRLQILSTEHWSLLASRSLAWNESFSRGGMFLATLSGAIVALALVAQATDFGEGFRIFGLVILPVVLFVGIGTNFRMGFSNYHDAICVMGMNRIRAGYLELAPDLERYFVMGSTDDQRGFELTQAMLPGTPLLVQMLASSPMLISVLNSVLAGAIVALAVLQVGGGTLPALGAGVVAFVASMAAFVWYAGRQISGVRDAFAPRFPTRPAPDT
ncbi:MAG TPA: hypothetical protein VJ820_08665 [Propionibacteriaceae bacterium]|nr:hypothetical protein [Propionibacteriaceae bacterium]